MNVELLQKVRAHILEEPRRFNLEHWGGVIDPKEYEHIEEPWPEAVEELEDVIAYQRPPCGAVGCIAGNTLILAGEVVPSEHFNGLEVYVMPDNTLELAAKALGIDEEAARRLFYLKEWGHRGIFFGKVGWPMEFEEELGKHSPGTIEYAEVAAKRIDHFIKTKGAE